MAGFVASRPIYACVFVCLYADISLVSLLLHGWIKSWGGAGGPDPTGKSQVTIGFLRNTGRDPR